MAQGKNVKWNQLLNLRLILLYTNQGKNWRVEIVRVIIHVVIANQENQEKKLSKKYRIKTDMQPSCKFQEITKKLLDFGVEYKHLKNC